MTKKKSESKPKTNKPKTPKKAATKKTTAKKAKKELPRIVLVGFSGAGKTSVANALAEKMNAVSIDLDEYIEANENRSVSQLIETLGEEVFREVETENLREVLSAPIAKIVALGGGTWTLEENRNLLKIDDSSVIWLDVSFEICWKRIKADKTRRPLAKTKSSAKKLFDKRREIYASADFALEIGAETSPELLAAEILQKLSA